MELNMEQYWKKTCHRLLDIGLEVHSPEIRKPNMQPELTWNVAPTVCWIKVCLWVRMAKSKSNLQSSLWQDLNIAVYWYSWTSLINSQEIRIKSIEILYWNLSKCKDLPFAKNYDTSKLKKTVQVFYLKVIHLKAAVVNRKNAGKRDRCKDR